MKAQTNLRGNTDAELISQEKSIDAVKDGGKTHSLAPQGSREWMDGAQLRHQNLFLLEVLSLSSLGLLRCSGQSNSFPVELYTPIIFLPLID